ncbi:SDR family oxidoreductase [Niabella sp. W65]|jgi:short-subunit dehydrogenase|nr:SDR family oxidoreductase [Niabella sp. W65]MCH7364200.1 SDR family oxidoreductase [Niabella sp. W65]ULT40071.1 SDR family oxidoreductase [Niabella sp. I65]
MNSYTLITGGSQGIGLSLAKQFAQNGYNLILVARDSSELEEASSSLAFYGVEIITMVKDLFNKDAAMELYNEVVNQGLQVDILVNNAGQGQYGLFEDTEIGRELAIIQLNVCSLVVLTKFFLRDMLQRGKGRILNLSSIAGKTPGPWQAVYHGTKAFVQSFTQALRSEVKDQGIVVTALLPGATDTDFFNKAGMNDSKAVEDKDALADPEEVARDGYNALMEGKDQVISGFKNKINVAMSNLMPDSAAADNMKNTQEPVDE